MTRRFVAVDLDNLLGCAPQTATLERYRRAFTSLVEAVRLSDNDLAVLAVPPSKAFVAAEVALGSRVVVRRGVDGADLRLIAELDDIDLIVRRFDEVVIASGDHLFCASVTRLNEAGVTTTVVALADQLSARLRLAARNVILLPQPDLRDAA